MADQIFVGRRKTAVARVILRSGNGTITVNGKAFEVAFPEAVSREDILGPFIVTDTQGKYDVSAKVAGGGITGQAQAIRLGIARSLESIDSEYRPRLKEAGFMTRDPRMVERKKYGQPKARKRFQFSKR
ncbi:MAG: 30S ribosomal protein S9 [Ignavibacteria bacterium]|nr:30S ribosomal protein S9 [Ignavibacteria bacterium]